MKHILFASVFAIFIVALALNSHCQQPFVPVIFNHIVVVAQENRTPDNLLGYCPNLGFADIIPSGSPVPLGTTADIPHNHANFLKEAPPSNIWPEASKHSVQLSEIQPYCDLLTLYGFNDRMFQSNQGPSRPAHDFLFGGTSAPVRPGMPHADWFAISNGGNCINATPESYIDSLGVTHSMNGCDEHDTLPDLLKAAGISWRYYTPSIGNIWTAPVNIRHICVPVNGKCTGPDWGNVVVNPSAVLSDIQNGTLAQMSWVIPSGMNSDHPGYGSGGPAWVAAVVNAIGGSQYWPDTVVIVVHDDWGGYYDHVLPLPAGYPDGTGKTYIHGFRVPLFVVSASTPPGYVSHTVSGFGSILKFVEDNWGLSLIGTGTYDDAFNVSLDLTMPQGMALRQFTAIEARPLTKDELEARDDPDSD